MFSHKYAKWSRTVLIITDQRIVDVNQKSLFDREVTEVRYHQIEDVLYRTRGFLPTLFRFGSLKIKLKGRASDILFHNIKKPERIQRLIQEVSTMMHKKQEINEVK